MLPSFFFSGDDITTRLSFSLRQTVRKQDTETRFFAPVTLTCDPMTLIYELDTKIPKTYLHTESELSKSRLSEVRAIHTDTHTTPHSRVVVMIIIMPMPITISTFMML